MHKTWMYLFYISMDSSVSASKQDADGKAFGWYASGAGFAVSKKEYDRCVISGAKQDWAWNLLRYALGRIWHSRLCAVGQCTAAVEFLLSAYRSVKNAESKGCGTGNMRCRIPV